MNYNSTIRKLKKFYFPGRFWLKSYFSEKHYKQKGNSNLIELINLYTNKREWLKRKEKIKKGIFETLNLDNIIENNENTDNKNDKIKNFKVNYKIISSQEIKLSRFFPFNIEVSNIMIETYPGLFIGANMYKPALSTGKDNVASNKRNNIGRINKKIPLILKPHGHFDDGRLRYDNQIICSTLASMGAAVITYDMIGYGDTKYIKHRHPYALQIQLWNSIQVLNFGLTFDYIDNEKVGITGASGGGTQTFLLTAIDDRIKASAPVVMVSSRFYGGCVCESGLPIHKSVQPATNNAEIAAMASPKPMLIVSEGTDWTRFVPWREFPYIQYIYSLEGSEGNVYNVHLPYERHNLGPNKRKAVYHFFSKIFELELREETPAAVVPIDSLKISDNSMERIKNIDGVEGMGRIVKFTNEPFFK